MCIGLYRLTDTPMLVGLYRGLDIVKTRVYNRRYIARQV